MVRKKKSTRPSRNPAGRPSGSPNKSTARVVNRLSREGQDPVEFLVAVMLGDRKALGLPAKPTKEQPHVISFDQRMWAANKLLPYRASRPVTLENEDGDDVAATFASIMAQMLGGRK